MGTDPICQARGTGQQCDEYPFYATEQGGALSTPRPHLKAVDGTQNTLQGSSYGSFVSGCHRNTGESEFLGIPVPASAPLIPTLHICNGN